MAKTTKPKTAVRMTLKDSEEAIASLLPDVKPDELGTEILKIVAAHAEMSKPAMAPEVEAAAPDDTAAKSAEGARAEDALPVADAGAESAAALDLMRDLLGKPDASFGEALDMLKAQADAIKAAISGGGAPAAQDAVDQAAQASAEGSAADVARGRDIASTRARIAALEVELGASRAKEWRSSVRSEVDAVMRTSGRSLGDDAIALLVEDAADVKDAKRRGSRIADAIAARGAIVATIMGSGSGNKSGGVDPVSDADEAVKQATTSLYSQGKRGRELHAAALDLARKNHPAAFSRNA